MLLRVVHIAFTEYVVLQNTVEHTALENYENTKKNKKPFIGTHPSRNPNKLSSLCGGQGPLCRRQFVKIAPIYVGSISQE